MNCPLPSHVSLSNLYNIGVIQEIHLMSFRNFQKSIVFIEASENNGFFYVYPDSLQKSTPLPETLDDALGNGFLTISLLHDDEWYLNIANEEYTGSLEKLESILYEWAISEGYSWK